MFEIVLVPTDLSKYSERAIECVTQIPGVRNIVIQHVVDGTEPSRHGWLLDREVENTRLRLGEIKSVLEKSGIGIRVRVDVIHEGDVPGRILETAREERATLIFLGARGKGIIRDILIGSVAHSVLRHARTNVLVMRHRVIKELRGDSLEKFCPHIFSKILCPSDFSPHSDAALSTAARISGDANIDLLHVVTKGETHEELNGRVQEAEKLLGDEKKRLASGDRTVSVYVRVGDPATEIERAAEELDSSLILMSPYGKGWFEELLLGSTTIEVARRSTRPVLVIKETVVGKP